MPGKDKRSTGKTAVGAAFKAVQRIGLVDYEPYLDAAIAMYTEEVGVTPLDGTGSYQRYVRMLIQMGHAMGAVPMGASYELSATGACGAG